MAEEEPAPERDPDFTFRVDQDPPLDQLKPLYAKILEKGPKPAVSLGLVAPNAAWDWLNRNHRRYAEAIGKRSSLLQAMRLPDRVELVGLAREP